MAHLKWRACGNAGKRGYAYITPPLARVVQSIQAGVWRSRSVVSSSKGGTKANGGDGSERNKGRSSLAEMQPPEVVRKIAPSCKPALARRVTGSSFDPRLSSQGCSSSDFGLRCWQATGGE